MGCAYSGTLWEQYKFWYRDGLQKPDYPERRALFHQQYIVLGKLGAGAFASVYAAHPVGDEATQVAVKVIDVRKPGSGSKWRSELTDAKRRERFMQEVAILQLVSGSEHLVSFVSAFSDRGLAYLVMEKCDSTLRCVLERMPELTEGSLRRIFHQMLSGIAAAHRARVVHRDVKPDNFLCTGPQATIKLCDFGLASEYVPRSSRGWDLEGVYGTPPFMAPEMLRGLPYGSKVDVWSFGVIAYVLLLGCFPYRPVQPTGESMKVAIMCGTPAPDFKSQSAEVPAPSHGAMSFLRALLSRTPGERMSAEVALHHRFLREGPGKTSQASLRPALAAAIQIGAFGHRHARDGRAAAEVDVRLAQLREQNHGPGTLKSLLSTPRSSDLSPMKRLGLRRSYSSASSSDGSTECGSEAATPATG